jgi:hypothetical protein
MNDGEDVRDDGVEDNDDDVGTVLLLDIEKDNDYYDNCY